ncbi:MAG: ATPase [Oscillospiraceae bacterium]|nr:ATPase [Oscillospiraceae bacterium]
MQYYIGIDGGGTKTAIAAAKQDASAVAFTKTGSASWREYGIPTVVNNIKQAIEGLPFQKKDSIAGMALGVPCYGESVEGDRELEQAFSAVFPGVPLYVTNDVEVGWAGSLGLLPGVNVVAGTGSIAFGKNQAGEAARSGGWSEFFGDEGSCYWLGRRVMELFSKQSDGRVERDALYETVRSSLALTDDFDFIDLMHDAYIPQRDKVASLQLIGMQAALAGSPSARALYAEAAAELCLLVRAIWDRIAPENDPFLVSYTGGLFQAGDLILPQFTKGIADLGGEVTLPKFGPAEGALLLAFSKFYPKALPQLQERLKNNEIRDKM